MSHVNQEMVKYSEVDGETITQCIQSTTVLTKEIKKATYPTNLIDFKESKNCKQNYPHLLAFATWKIATIVQH